MIYNNTVSIIYNNNASGDMKCTYCRRTDGQDDDKPRQCMCYTWFVYTCSVCLVTFLIGLACCAYCTCLLVSINKTMKAHEDQVKGEVALRNNGAQEVVAAQEYITQKRSTHATDNSLAHTARIRRKRNKEEKKKEKKRRKGNGGKGKKKQRTQAAHYVLRKGLADGGANCQTNKVYGPTELRGTLDVFKLASFIKTKSNPFHEIEGRFIAKKRGLYLVYAQIMFEDCKPHEVMKIVQKRKNISGEVTIQEHFCIIGAPKTEKSYNNTCAMTSLFFLETDDYLTVVNYYPEVHINLGGNGTFFGAVYLR